MTDLVEINVEGVTSIWGGRGAGKTYFAKNKIFPQLKDCRILVIDPLATTGFRTALEVRDALYAGERRVILNSGDHVQAVAAIYTAWAHSTKASPIYAICDEAPEYLKFTTERLQVIMYQGRHRKFGMCLMGQQPTAINSRIRSQAADTFWMRLSDHNDVQIAAKSLGAERARGLQTFRQGDYIRHPPANTNAQPAANTNAAPKTEPEWE